MKTIPKKTDSQRPSGRLDRLVRHLDLFSGIGGFALAARWVGGIETIGFCEIDPWAQKVLNKNFPGIECHNDVKTLDPKNYGRIDLITGGYPCQPFSVAGQQRGSEDDRHLWPEVFRIIKEARPRMVLCENVAGHVNLGLDEVLSDLASEGYAAEPIIIPACAVDAKHRRDRVWIMGYAEHDGPPSAEVGGISNQTSDDDKEGQNKACQSTGASGRKHDADVANSKRGARETQLPRQEPEILREKNQRRQTDGLSAHDVSTGREWATEPELGRVADGIPDRAHRLKGLGNAIVPQVAAEILRVMMEVDSYYPPNV